MISHKRSVGIKWVAFCIVIGLLAGGIKCAQTAKTGLGDSDYFWHCTLGRDILTAGEIPDADTYSWLSEENGYKETAHSWLGSVIVYLCSCVFSGDDGIFKGALLFIFVTTALLGFLLVYLFGLPFDTGNPKCDFINCMTGLLGLCSCMTYMTARPLNFGLICFVLGLYLLQDAYNNPESKKWLWLPVVSFFWANLHGGSVPILFAFNGLFFVMSFIPEFSFTGVVQDEGFSRKRTLKLAAAGAADVIAALVNPYSYRLFVYFFVTNTEVTKSRISEWQPATLGNITLIASLVILAAVLLLKNRRISFSYLMPALCCLAMTVKYARIVSYLILSCVMLAYKVLSDMYADCEPAKMNRSRVGRITVMLVFCSVLFSFGSFMLVGDMRKSAEDNGLVLDAAAVEHLTSAKYRRLYCGYNYGGVLIFNGIQSFIDSRADPFPDDILSRAIEFEKGENFSAQDFRDYLAEYRFDGAVVPCGSHLDCVFSMLSDWNAAYRDDFYSIYIPVN